MSTIAEEITIIRELIDDNDSVRWTDASILIHIKRAIERANQILANQGLHFARSSYAFSTVVDTATYALPSDFMVPQTIIDLDNDIELIHLIDFEFDMLFSPPDERFWRISGTNIEISGTPSEVISMKLYYYPKIDMSAYTTATDMPWDDRNNLPLQEYVKNVLLNIDEMNVTLDLKFAAELEDNMLRTFSQLEPTSPGGVESYFPRPARYGRTAHGRGVY